MSDEPRRIFRLTSARDSVEREVDDEIRFHIETRSQELEREGMRPAAAKEQARREFGDAAAALLLAAVGLYGVIAYGVRQRVHQIGIRLALGGRAADVQRLVIREGVTLTLVGLVLGAAAAIALSGLLRRQLYGVSPADPATYVGIGVLLLVVAVAASWIPAWRASRVEPVRALRGE